MLSYVHIFFLLVDQKRFCHRWWHCRLLILPFEKSVMGVLLWPRHILRTKQQVCWILENYDQSGYLIICFVLERNKQFGNLTDVNSFNQYLFKLTLKILILIALAVLYCFWLTQVILGHKSLHQLFQMSLHLLNG